MITFPRCVDPTVTRDLARDQAVTRDPAVTQDPANTHELIRVTCPYCLNFIELLLLHV